MAAVTPDALSPLALLTKHGKQAAVTEALANAGFQVFTVSDFDTDQLGTFTGEIARRGSPLEAATTKAKLAAESGQVRYGLGSEGSFGPDPYIGISPWGMEILAWWDAELGYGVHAMVQGPETNFAHLETADRQQALNFVQQIGFPAHGLIVGKPGQPGFNKELTDTDALLSAVDQQLAQGKAWLETDMRAHRNPTRMDMIRRCAEALSARLLAACPACQKPGWGPVGVIAGAVCRDCGAPTRAARAYALQCQHCGHQAEQPVQATVPPDRCDHCNP